MKQYTTATKYQLQLKEEIIEAAKMGCTSPEYFDIEVSYERIFLYSGALCFVLRSKAKENTGMLYMCERSYMVEIGRRGAVKTARINYDNNDVKLRSNKNYIFTF